MSADIDMSNDRANIAFVGNTPWHGMGVAMPGGADLLTWRKEAGLDWEAKRAQIQFMDGEEMLQGESDILYRSDTKAQLGIVSDRYKVVQPADVVDFFKELCEINGFNMNTMGSLAGGKRIWALAETGESFRLMGQDKVDSYVLLATSFDGTLATRAQFTTVRVVCQNTLSMAVSSKGGSFVSVNHSANFDAKSVKTNLGIHHDAFSNMEEKAGILAQKGPNDAQVVRFLVDIFAGEEAKIEELSTRKGNIIADVKSLYEGKGMGSDLRSSKGTMWGLVNAVTEYVDHHKGYKADARLNTAWFGTGDTLKTKAFTHALKLAA